MVLLTILLISTAKLALGVPHCSHTDMIQAYESQRASRLTSLDADSVHSYNQTGLLLDYRVENDLNAPLSGRASITLTANEVMTSIPFNAESLVIDGVSELGETLSFQYANDTLWVGKTLLPGESTTIDIELTAPVYPNLFEEGFHTEWERAYTNCEPFGARRWFPCWDQPYDKFDELTVAVNMPDHWSLASNGFPTSTTYPEAGRKREVYQYNGPISSYLVMIAAGLYAKRFETFDGVEYRYFTYPEDSLEAVFDWGQTPQMVNVYSGLVGSYPFAAYGMVETSIFNGWGAMEHQTFTTYGRRLINGLGTYEDIVAHELVHQWFGDCLSPVDFRNIWLNEGFATYFAAVWFEETLGEDDFRDELASMAAAYFNEDRNELRYAAYDPPEAYLFGNVEYEKAGWVLHMLRKQLLGDDLFYTVMHEWVSRYAFGTVNTEDFIDLVNEFSGQDYRWFFQQWIYEAGHPELWIDISVLPDIDDVVIHSIQVQYDAPVFRYPLQIEVTTTEQTLIQTVWFHDRNQMESLHIPGVISARLADFQDLLYETSTTATDPTMPELPLTAELLPAYPNPFNSAISIPFELNSRTRAKISIYNTNGQLVRNIVDAVFNSGKHTLTFAADASLSSGIYLVRFETGPVAQTRKIVLVK